MSQSVERVVEAHLRSLTAGKYVKIFHATPEAGITRFHGVYSPKFHAKGLFVSPSFKSIREDWAAYVFNKRSKTDTHQPHRDTPYDNLTVYTLAVPSDVYEVSEGGHLALADKAFEEQGSGAIGAWGWGAEVFIPEEYLPQLKIVGRTTLDEHDFEAPTRTPREEESLDTIARKVQKTNPAAKLYLEIKDTVADSILKFGKNLDLLRNSKYLQDMLKELIVTWGNAQRIETLSPKEMKTYEGIRATWDKRVKPMLLTKPSFPNADRVANKYLQAGWFSTDEDLLVNALSGAVDSVNKALGELAQAVHVSEDSELGYEGDIHRAIRSLESVHLDVLARKITQDIK